MTFADHATDLATVLQTEWGETVTLTRDPDGASPTEQELTGWRSPRASETLQVTPAVGRTAYSHRMAWCFEAADLASGGDVSAGDLITVGVETKQYRVITGGVFGPGQDHLDDTGTIVQIECAVEDLEV